MHHTFFFQLVVAISLMTTCAVAGHQGPGAAAPSRYIAGALVALAIPAWCAPVLDSSDLAIGEDSAKETDSQFHLPIKRAELQSRAQPCFIIGNTSLPKESQDAANFLSSRITCDNNKKTISGVPDVSTGGVTFSSINFAASGQSPLEFALSKFATTSPLAKNDLTKFDNEGSVYTATEIGLRSVGGKLDIKAPKFFIAMQIARIKTAQGNPPTDPSQTVEHLLGKVAKNASKADKRFVDQITALSKVLA